MKIHLIYRIELIAFLLQFNSTHSLFIAIQFNSIQFNSIQFNSIQFNSTHNLIYFAFYF